MTFRTLLFFFFLIKIKSRQVTGNNFQYSFKKSISIKNIMKLNPITYKTSKQNNFRPELKSALTALADDFGCMFFIQKYLNLRIHAAEKVENFYNDSAEE